jgi:hypothetical protein
LTRIYTVSPYNINNFCTADTANNYTSLLDREASGRIFKKYNGGVLHIQVIGRKLTDAVSTIEGMKAPMKSAGAWKKFGNTAIKIH